MSGILRGERFPCRATLEDSMKLNYTSVLFLTLFGATAGFAQVTLNPVPSRAIGQAILIPESGNPNLVEGRELYSPQGIAVDNSASPPIVYVADIKRKSEMNRAWDEWADPSNPPMRACIGVELEPPHIVEIVVTAAK